MNSKRLLMIGAILILSLFGFLFLRPEASDTTAQTIQTPSISDTPNAVIITINDQPYTTSSELNSAPLMNTQPLSKINLSQIANIEQEGVNWVVTFIDNSQSWVTPNLQSQLPSELQYRMGYHREEN